MIVVMFAGWSVGQSVGRSCGENLPHADECLHIVAKDIFIFFSFQNQNTKAALKAH